MEAIDFKEKNVDFAKNQEEYKTLPAHLREGEDGEVIFCMKLTWKERFKILLTGELWACLLTFNKPLQPSRFSVYKEDFFSDSE